MARQPDPREALKARYEHLDRADLGRQGRDLLRGRADGQAKRTGRWLWLVVGTTGIAGLLLIGSVALWLMHMAEKMGTSWHDTARQAAEAYTGPDQD